MLGFKKTHGKTTGEAFFGGEFLDEVTLTLLQEFMESLPVSTKTKRHYQEFFHRFAEDFLVVTMVQAWVCVRKLRPTSTRLAKAKRV